MRFVGLGLAWGCVQDFGVFELDASTADAAQDGASDGSAKDVSTKDVSDAGGGDASVTFQCGSGTVSDCSQCNGMPEPCVYCSINNSAVLSGVCTQANGTCFQGIPNGFVFCHCSADPSMCPESYQVCRNGNCRTCAESTMNNGLTCHGGGTCNSTTGACN